MSHYEIIKTQFGLPFELRAFQQEAIESLVDYERSALWFDTGTGKTATSTGMALSRIVLGRTDKAVVVMPPILLGGWARFLRSITGLEGQVMIYRGTPAQRRKLELGEATFTLMSYGIMKNDKARLTQVFKNHRVLYIADEATALKNVTSENYKTFNRLTLEQALVLLSGTPLATPMDAYAYCRLKTPATYRSKSQFENIHVEKRDFFNKPTAWRHLDVIDENMMEQARRVLKREVLKDLPPVTYTPIPYSLIPAHQKLYRQLVDEQVAVLEDGGKIDGTSGPRLYHMLQQVICNWEHFAGGPVSGEPPAYELIEQTLEELAGKKLIVGVQYRMTNETLLKRFEKYNPRIIYGGNPHNEKAKDEFVDDPSVQVLFIQPKAGGMGLDGMQHVCSNMLFIETPTLPMDFHQLVARLDRDGQTEPVSVRIGIAEGTIQVRLHANLLDNDALVNQALRGPEDLRAALYGE